MPTALVCGSGVAGLAAARRLAKAGWDVDLVGRVPTAERIVTLDQSVVDLFRLEFATDVFDRVERVWLDSRELAWTTSDSECVEGSLMVLELGALAQAIEAHLPPRVRTASGPRPDHRYDRIFDATGRPEKPLLRSGDRTAWQWLVPWTTDRPSALLKADTANGWVFVATAPGGRLMVQLMRPGNFANTDWVQAISAATQLLENTPFAAAAPKIAARPATMIDATPLFSAPIGPDGAIRLGDATAAGDPLAGDGVGRALRTAVMAVVALTDSGFTRTCTLNDYSHRLIEAHKTHLESSARYYAASRCRGMFARQTALALEHSQHLERLLLA